MDSLLYLFWQVVVLAWYGLIITILCVLIAIIATAGIKFAVNIATDNL